MPDDLYDRDVLAWSGQQAKLLRRVANGERVNDIDWEHVVEEIEDAGRSELNATRAYLRQTLAHLLNPCLWPDSDASKHWRNEVATFQVEILGHYPRSMRRRIDLPKLYDLAQCQIEPMPREGSAAAPPASCPVTLDRLLNASVADLEATFTTAASDSP